MRELSRPSNFVICFLEIVLQAWFVNTKKKTLCMNIYLIPLSQKVSFDISLVHINLEKANTMPQRNFRHLKSFVCFVLQRSHLPFVRISFQIYIEIQIYKYKNKPIQKIQKLTIQLQQQKNTKTNNENTKTNNKHTDCLFCPQAVTGLLCENFICIFDQQTFIHVALFDQHRRATT